MKILFEKYQGTGNDFIMLDNRSGQYDWLSIDQVQFLCDRRFGIGADGLIRINKCPGFDYELDYFNSDGTKSFCGNGARCGLAFSKALGFISSEVSFLGCDGPHRAALSATEFQIDMLPVLAVNRDGDDYVLHTGSPHYVRFVTDVESADMFNEGRRIRYSPSYANEGINVNLVEVINANTIAIRTYERGVENETLSCGTGATACALVWAAKQSLTGEHALSVKVKGGELKIRFERNENGEFHNVQLIGPAVRVFAGEIDLAVGMNTQL